MTRWILFFCLFSSSGLPAAELSVGGREKLRAIVERRQLDAEGGKALLTAAQKAAAIGTAEREIVALCDTAPASAKAADLGRAVDELAGLVSDGLADRDARKAALKSLEARLKQGAKEVTAASVDETLRQKRRQKNEAAAASEDRARRDEARERTGRRNADGDPGVATPAPN